MTTNNGLYFRAYESLSDTPNIIVDGAATSATEITLSHWPKSATPYPLKADSSAEIVFNYLHNPGFHVNARAVSNNHFDVDGLVSAFILLYQDYALEHRELLIDIAQSGDFKKYRDRQAARVTFTISSFSQQPTSPLDLKIFDLNYTQQCSALYQELLPRLECFIADTERYKQYWEEEDSWLAESESAIKEGLVTIKESAEHGLARVTIAEEWVPSFTTAETLPVNELCHPMAINGLTDCNRILTIQGQRFSVQYRYESWVQFMSRPVASRVDLTALALDLNSIESGSAHWIFDDVSNIRPILQIKSGGESSIDPEQFQQQLINFLSNAVVAWDPYD